MDIETKTSQELFDLFENVHNNKSYDCYRFMAEQIVSSGKVYVSNYDFIKDRIENGELPAEDAYVLLIREIRETLKSLKKIEYLIESKLGQ